MCSSFAFCSSSFTFGDINKRSWQSFPSRKSILHFRTSRTVRACAMPSIEVECKFGSGGDGVSRLIEACSPQNEQVFIDSYVDAELACSDIWLRRRDSEWELKLPVQGATESDGGTSAYKEVTGGEVWSELSRMGLNYTKTPYATLRTHRRSMQLTWQNYDVCVTLDQCSAGNDFNCNIGEIEILVAHKREVPSAAAALNEVIKYFDLDKLNQDSAKLVLYLKEKNPDLFKRIVSCILSKRK